MHVIAYACLDILQGLYLPVPEVTEFISPSFMAIKPFSLVSYTHWHSSSTSEVLRLRYDFPTLRSLKMEQFLFRYKTSKVLCDREGCDPWMYAQNEKHQILHATLEL